MGLEGRRRFSVTITSVIIALMVFCGHLAFGANRYNLALGFSGLWLVALALILAFSALARQALSARSLYLLAALYGSLILLIGLSLTALAPGGPNPIWTFVKTTHSAATLDPYATIVELVKLSAVAASFLVGCAWASDDDQAKALVRAILWTGLIYSVWALIDHMTSPRVIFGVPRPFDPSRLSASFDSANTAATWFGALTLLNIGDLARTWRLSRPEGRWYAHKIQSLMIKTARPLFGFLFAAACLILTFSRAGLTATVGAALALLGALALTQTRRGRIASPAIATGLVVIGGLIASLSVNADDVALRFGLLGQDNNVRGRIFAAHWAAFQAAPWSGYGLGTFAHINALITNASNIDVLGDLGATHNVYIQWLEEAGVPATLLMLAVVGVITLTLLKGAVRRRRQRPWILAILALVVLFALHGASDFALQTPSMALSLGLLLGIGVGLGGPGVNRYGSLTP